MIFYAHSDPDPEKWQLLSDHLQQVALQCAAFLAPLGFADFGRLLGLIHDFGKYAVEYQHYLQSAGGRLKPGDDGFLPNAKSYRGKIPHSGAGARLIWNADLEPLLKILLAYPTACHHSGPEDFYDLQGVGRFSLRMNADYPYSLKQMRDAAEAEITAEIDRLLHSDIFRRDFQNSVTRMLEVEKTDSSDRSKIIPFRCGLLLRLFSSALIDADRLSAAGFSAVSVPCNWFGLTAQFETKLKELKCSDDIGKIRFDISSQCLAAAERPAGAVYRLTVPTGGGKTLSGARFALAHAKKHGLNRIFYVAPLLSIVEQNAQVLREHFEDRNVVYECHSNLLPERIENEEHRRMIENWDAPILCTTFVQMLNAIFSGENRHIRRFHTLAHSVILFDEIQNIPITMLHLFNAAINFITRKMGATVVLVSATQPPLHELKRHGALQLADSPELSVDMQTLLPRMKRVSVQTRDDLDTDEKSAPFFAELARNNGSVLIVANTRRHVEKLFRILQNPDFAVFHLSTNMCPLHRKIAFSKIKEALDSKTKPVIVISTSLIQAGCDISFRSAVRYLCGLDSIFQTSGRCNRHKENDLGDVYVLPNPPEVKPPRFIRQQIEAAKCALRKFKIQPERYHHELFHPLLLDDYYKELYEHLQPEMLYPIKTPKISTNLLELLSDNRLSLEAFVQENERQPENRCFVGAYRTAGEHFRAIEYFDEESVVVPYRAGRVLIDALKNSDSPACLNQLLKKAQRYSVNVSASALKRLHDLGAIHEIPCGVRYLDPEFYNPNTGISIF